MFPSGGDRVRPTDTPPAFYEADSQQSQYEKPQGMAMSRSDEERDGEAIAQEEYSSISVSQKMISATWGSILTSLLGDYPAIFRPFIFSFSTKLTGVISSHTS